MYLNGNMNYQYGTQPLGGIQELDPIESLLTNVYGPGFPDRIDPSRQVGMDAVLGTIGKTAGSTLGPLGGTLLGYVGNIAAKGIDTVLQNTSQRSLMHYQMSLNSPEAMMARMRSAGINPAAAAQGIAGSPGAGSVAGGSAGMSQGMPGLIDALANSENTALNAQYLRTQNEQMKVATEGMKMDNKMKAIETNTYPEYRNAEIQQMVEDANEKAANVLKMVEEKKNLIEERNNIKQEYNNLVAQEGEIKAKEALEKSEKAVADADASIKNATLNVGYAPGTSEYVLTKAAMEAAEKGIPVEEYGPYKTALNNLYHASNAPARGAYDSDPGHQTFREAKDAIVYLQDQKNAINKQLDSLAAQYMDADEEQGKQIFAEMSRLKRLRGECVDAIKNADKAFKKESYKNGYYTQWQNSVDAIVKGVSTGVGIGIGAVGTNAVGKVYGAGKAAFGKQQYDKGYYQGSTYGF